MHWPPDLTITMTTPMFCNAVPPCPYCIDIECGIETIPWEPQKWLAGLLDLGDRYGQLHILSPAAEPMSNSELTGLLRLVANEHYVSTSTNLIAPAELYEYHFAGVESINFCASFHPHLWRSIDEYLDKLDDVRSRGVKFSGTTVIGWPPLLDHIPEWQDALQKDERTHGLINHIAPFNGVYNSIHYPTSYTPEDRKIICPQDDTSEHFRFKGENSLKGRRCNAGHSFMHINPFGIASACYMNPGSNILGSLIDRDITTYETARPCISDWCACESMWEFVIE